MDRKLEFNLSFEYVKKLLEYTKCFYTKKSFSEDGPDSRSFDRIDSDLGYVEGNVVSCTVDINGKKSNLSYDEIKCIYEKLNSHKNNSWDEDHALDLVMNDMVKDFTQEDIQKIIDTNEEEIEPNEDLKLATEMFKEIVVNDPEEVVVEDTLKEVEPPVSKTNVSPYLRVGNRVIPRNKRYGK